MYTFVQHYFLNFRKILSIVTPLIFMVKVPHTKFVTSYTVPNFERVEILFSVRFKEMEDFIKHPVDHINQTNE